MAIPRARYEKYSAYLKEQEELCAADLARYVSTLDMDDPEAVRDAVAEYSKILVNAYGGNAATLAAEFVEQSIDDMALLDNRDYDEQVEGSTRYAAKHLFEGNTDAFVKAMQASLRRYVRQQAARTMTDNARRGFGLRFARIPTSPDPCGFCIMLASRGFVYYTAETAGEFCAFHDHCRCDVIAGTDDALEGYSTEGYEDLYDEATHMKGSHTSRGALDAKGIARNIDILTGNTSEDQTT